MIIITHRYHNFPRHIDAPSTAISHSKIQQLPPRCRVGALAICSPRQFSRRAAWFRDDDIFWLEPRRDRLLCLLTSTQTLSIWLATRAHATAGRIFSFAAIGFQEDLSKRITLTHIIIYDALTVLWPLELPDSYQHRLAA
jgi:hypothetical protein